MNLLMGQTIMRGQQAFYRSGQVLVELLVAIGLFAVLTPALFTGLLASREGRAQQQQRFQAQLLVNEATEAVRSVREAGWEEVANNGTYHPEIDNFTWTLGVGSETSGEFTRRVVISDVYRNSSGTIVDVGGSRDPGTKRIDISVSWGSPLASTITNTIYLTRYLDNEGLVHTTQADFELTGYQTNNADITNQAGGEVQLSISGLGRSDWCEPDLVSALNLVGQGNAHALTAIPYELFIGTGGNASGDPLTYVTSTNANPPVLTAAGIYSGSNKDNDVFGETGYAYLATDTNNAEVVILNTSTMTSVGTFDSPGPSDANSVFVKSNVGYVTAGTTLYTFDLSSKTGSRSQMGSVTLPNVGKSVYVAGNYAFVATEGTSSQLVIIDATNPSSLSQVGSLTVTGGVGRDVYASADATRAYLVTATNASQAEFFLIDTSIKNAPNLISSFDTNGMDPQGVEVVLNGNRAILVGMGGIEYQVLSLARENQPTLCGSLNNDSGFYDISAVEEADEDVYAYVSSGDASGELKVVEGGPGDTYETSGWYESGVVDLGTEVVVNRIQPTAIEPAQTSAQYQLAVTDAVSGSCTAASYVFVGPDGTSGSYFDGLAGAPWDDDGSGYENPGRCLKYRVFLETTDEYATPRFDEITINYSP